MNSSRRLLIVAFSILLLTCGASSQESTPRIVDRGPHHARWERVTHVVDDQGRAEWTTNSWTQLETGLNYWDEVGGSWAEARDLIEITPNGAVARYGQHRVIFSTNVNDPEGAVDVEVNRQARFRASVLALRYFDPATGLSAPIALVQDATGELLPPNQVLYRNAFRGISADVLYTVRRGSFESDVILREIPPSPEEAGLKEFSDAIRIEVLTEFFESRQPEKRERILARVEDEELRAQVAEPDWKDEELDFGPNWIGQGRAFAWSAREAATHSPEGFPAVSKRWLSMDGGKHLLIEAVEYVQLFQELAGLPGSPDRRQELARMRDQWVREGSTHSRQERLGLWASLQKARQTTSSRSATLAEIPSRIQLRRSERGDKQSRIQLSSVPDRTHAGLVIDWTSIPTGVANQTFQGDETYYVTGNAWFWGITTIEGGAVFKFQQYTNSFNNWVGICLQGGASIKTGLYRPAVFTAENDNSVGASIFPGSPSLTADYGNRQLRFKDFATPIVVEHMIFRYGREALYFQGNNPHSTIRHCQFVNSWSPIASDSTNPMRVQNVLVDQTKLNGRVFAGGANTPVFAEHVTIRSAPNLHVGVTLNLTNSILAEVATVQSYSGANNHQTSSSLGLFQSVGAGNFYLAPGSSLRNAGSPGIDPALRTDLRTLTTHPPFLLTQPVTQPTTLAPIIPRDVDIPDLGYHYPALDYCASSVSIQNATLTVSGGTAIAAFGTNAFLLAPGSRFVSHGMPDNLNVLTRYQFVQEQASVWGASATDLFQFLGIQAPSATGTDTPSVSLRYSRVSFPATSPSNTANRDFLQTDGVYPASPFEIVHSQIAGAHLRFSNPSVVRSAVQWTNSLFERCKITFHDPPGANVLDISLANNLFYGGRIDLENNEGLGTWVLRDNLFATNEVWAVAPFQSYFNAIAAPVFLSGLSAFGTGVRTDLVVDFVPGPFGRFYYPPTGSSSSLASLTDQGSRTADTAGLYHFTTRTDQRRETNSIVDVGFHYPSTGVTPIGLVALYDFEEGGGSITADGSGNGNTGTLYNGATWTTGRRGRGVAFDGNNDYVGVLDSPTLRLTQPFTVSAWVQKSSEKAYWQPYLSKQSSLSTRNYWLGDWDGASGLADGSYWDTSSPSGAQRDVSGTSHLPVGVWAHLTWTWDGASQRLYVNGVLDGTLTSSSFPPVTSSAPLAIGGYSYMSASMHGALDEVRLYNRALSGVEIRELANSGLADFDSDGLPDAVEDLDGDGTADPGESDWTQSTSGPGATLKVYTPLR